MRFLFVTPRLFPSVLVAALVLTGVSGAVIAAARVPYDLFEPDDGTLILGTSAGNPLRGSASRFVGTHATILDNVSGASPEILAPTVVSGEPVMVRGVLPDSWRAVDPVVLREGRWASSPGEATVGARLARGSGLGVGDHVLVPGAYRATLGSLRIVGVHEGAGLADDQLVTDLDTAAGLAGLPPSRVHMVRLRAEEGALEGPDGQWLHALSLELRPAHPVPNTPAVARVDLLNLGSVNATRVLNLRVNGILAASVVAHVPAETRTHVDIPFLVPDSGQLRLEVNPKANASTSAPGLVVEAPQRVAKGDLFDVSVSTPDGAPVEGARIVAGDEGALTNATGRARVRAGDEGELVVSATAGNRSGGRVVYVVDPARALQPVVQATAGVVTRVLEHNATHVRYGLLVTFVNIGGADFAGPVEARANGTLAGLVRVELPIEARATVAFEALAPRNATRLDIAGLGLPLPRREAGDVPPQQRIRTVDEVLREKRVEAEREKGGRTLNAQSFVEDVFAGLEPSVAVVVLATFLHAGAGVALAVLREVREREEVAVILRELGATPDQVAFRAMRDAVVSVLPPILLGSALAWATLAALRPYGWPAAFGTTLPLVVDLAFFARVVGGLTVIAALTAYWAAYSQRKAVRRQTSRVQLAELLGERE